MAVSSFTAMLMMRATVAPNGWPRATLPPLGFKRSRGEVARHTSALSQERLVLQRLEMERQLCGEGLTYLILDVAHPPNETRSAVRDEG
jgi:hypothetical protein